MRKCSLILVLLVLLSCRSQVKKEVCVYTLSDLLIGKEMSKMTIKSNDTLIEVSDVVDNGDRGLYRFGKDERLRYYGFLVNNKYESWFDVDYNDKGEELNNSILGVVKWYLAKIDSDSLRIEFLLYSVNRKYGGIDLYYGKRKYELSLYESKSFSNLIGSKVIVPIEKENIIYLRGKVKRCNDIDAKPFEDSVYIPQAILSVN